MRKFVQYEKLSKKEKKKIDSLQRKTWSDYGSIVPAVRIIPDAKKEREKYSCRRTADQ